MKANMKLKANMEDVTKTHFEANSFAACLMTWMQQNIPIHASALSSAEVDAELHRISDNNEGMALFQVNEAKDWWDKEARRTVLVNHDEIVNFDMFADLGRWWELCYAQCYRKEASQVSVAMVQDPCRLLPPQVVAHVYLPKQGWGADCTQPLMNKVQEKLVSAELFAFLEVTDGAYNSLRNEYEGKPLHVMHMYEQVKQRVAAWYRSTCLKNNLTVIADLVGLTLHTFFHERGVKLYLVFRKCM
jgi:hypothetical protein